MAKRILVLTDHMPWGHRSIAKAISGYLKDSETKGGYRIDYAEVKAETGIGGDMYNLAYRYFPSSNKILHKMAENSVAREILEQLSMFNFKALRRVINRHKPDLIICTYYLHSHALVKLREREEYDYQLWTVVADPWTINAVSYVSGADLHIVYDQMGTKVAEKYGIDKSKVLETGWWVRQEMYQKYDREKARLKLGFNDNRRVIFVGGGSLGTNSLYRILPVLMYVDKPLGVVFNSGTDKLAYNLVDQYQKLFRKLKKGDMVQIKNLGWIDNIAEVLAGCDIVLGKAGPNFLFDVMAAQKPFVAITHIGGQEDGNISLIKKKRLGWVKEKNGQIGKFIIKYLQNPKSFEEKFQAEIRAEAEKNRKALEKIFLKIKG